MAKTIFGEFKKARKNSAKVAEFKKLGLTLVGHLTTTKATRLYKADVSKDTLCRWAMACLTDSEALFHDAMEELRRRYKYVTEVGGRIYIATDDKNALEFLGVIKAYASPQRHPDLRKEFAKSHARTQILALLEQGIWVATARIKWAFGELAARWITYRNKFCGIVKRAGARFVSIFEQMFGMFSAKATIADLIRK